MLEETVKRIEPKEEYNSTLISACNLLLYIEDSNYNYQDVLKRITEWDKVCSFAYCLHDNDYYHENTFNDKGILVGNVGDKKQNHIHVVIAFTSKQRISKIADELGLKNRFIQKCKNFDKSILYLTHRNAEDKYQYPLENVVTNIRPYVEYLYNNYTPTLSPINYLWRYLGITEYPTYTGFIQFLPDEVSVQGARKYWGMIRDIITENKLRQQELENEINMRKEDRKRVNEAIEKLCKTFGSVTVENDKSIEQYKLSTDGKVDIMGLKLKEEENKQ